ncbi:Rieske (2Fe-2S) protein [Zeaxanthinibacter enoshimensis]|uniref:Nitrite reductase/ring-hydroxylating ferredoxin subunit n=1 Tax=Zeaxanthinibacter enoshimensis TaxID=392009 RepID=A0A4R6TNQ0_9FLAO|nr:hypothetical protein [Zeaxanthinibacter enoshimensis]TDQ33184.1 hypothetical protein CLV82_1022 [Zeaxanthinibacter enoshimensis]
MKSFPHISRCLSALLLLLTFSCSSDGTNRNPFLPEIGFRFEVNTNLPLYSALNNDGNSVYINTQGVGIRGVYVTNTGFSTYRAFEASCPNHSPNECSTLEQDGQVAECGCDNFRYSLFTGQLLNRPDDGNRYYDMLEYRATRSGNVILISN